MIERLRRCSRTVESAILGRLRDRIGPEAWVVLLHARAGQQVKDPQATLLRVELSRALEELAG
jgi:hypothetical protein